MATTIKIKQPFYSAGMKYGWPGKSVGVGINFDYLEGDGMIRVSIGDHSPTLEADKYELRKFIETYKSVFIAKGRKLGVVPVYLFKSL